jgi:hypothetical protein
MSFEKWPSVWTFDCPDTSSLSVGVEDGRATAPAAGIIVPRKL